MRKFILLAAISLMSLNLSGCGSNSERDGVNASSCYGTGAVAGCSKYGERYYKQYNPAKWTTAEEKRTGGMMKEADFINSIGQKKGSRK